MTIWALHGFLGLPDDFDLLKAEVLAHFPHAHWKSVDYCHLRELSPNNTLGEWGVHFTNFVQKTVNTQDHVLLGYSQGGRLALQALSAQPSLWKAVILLSTNLGLAEAEKPQRQRHDEEWAETFLHENFQRTVEKWNAQNVFVGSKSEPVREESKFNRRQLADCLTRWSVARQQNFAATLGTFSNPILYVAGEADKKYCLMGEELQRNHSEVRFEIIPDSGHRVLFDQPRMLANIMQKFLSEIKMPI